MNHTSTTKSSFRSVYRTIRRTLVAVISIAAVSAAFILPAAGCTSKNDSRFKSISLSYPEKNRIATLLECVSGTEYDFATKEWGDDWRVPKASELKNLIDLCTWTWATNNNVAGYTVTGIITEPSTAGEGMCDMTEKRLTICSGAL